MLQKITITATATRGEKPLFLYSFFNEFPEEVLSPIILAKVIDRIPEKSRVWDLPKLLYQNNAEGASSVFHASKLTFALDRIRSAQWVFGSKLTGEPAYKNLQGSSEIK